MSALAHVLEANGLSTVAFGSVRPHIEQIAPPRGLWCDFPLGRPLGIPGDSAFQHQVLAKAFDMLGAEGPLFEAYDVAIATDEADEPLSCTMPPRFDPDEHPAVDEARGLRPAYDRVVAADGNRIGACREIGPDEVPAAVAAWVRVTEGAGWKEAGIRGDPMRVAQDIRGYYQTAAVALADHTPDAWSAESWFYDRTEAGKVMIDARQAIKDAGEPHGRWFYLTPGDR